MNPKENILKGISTFQRPDIEISKSLRFSCLLTSQKIENKIYFLCAMLPYYIFCENPIQQIQQLSFHRDKNLSLKTM